MARELVIDGFKINDGSDCYVIAEIGHNHQGDIEQCKQMFDVAKQCGANAVKLQKRDNRTMFTKEMYDSPYLHRNSYAPTYGEHRDKLEFTKEQHIELIAHAKKIGITFFSTASISRAPIFWPNSACRPTRSLRATRSTFRCCVMSRSSASR
jgi:sialic acid synthase